MICMLAFARVGDDWYAEYSLTSLSGKFEQYLLGWLLSSQLLCRAIITRLIFSKILTSVTH